jgi:hypothetical protein
LESYLFKNLVKFSMRTLFLNALEYLFLIYNTSFVLCVWIFKTLPDGFQILIFSKLMDRRALRAVMRMHASLIPYCCSIMILLTLRGLFRTGIFFYWKK